MIEDLGEGVRNLGMRWVFGWCLLLVGLRVESANQPPVDLIPMPDRGVQPQVQVGPSGDIHLVYHKENLVKGICSTSE